MTRTVAGYLPSYTGYVLKPYRANHGDTVVKTNAYVRAEISFRNFINSTRNQVVFTNFQLIRIQTDFRLDTNQSENSK